MFFSVKQALRRLVSESLGRNMPKNASTGPNKFNIQYHYAPEIPIKPTAFVVFGCRKHGSDSWG